MSHSIRHHYDDLIRLFNQCFEHEYNTILVKGADEPLYLPADENRPRHTIFFAHGYFSSALHECAHWFIAGTERRQLVDFGYWYEPDGRSAEQQRLFQQLEVKPQAIECILSMACGHRFHISVDNLNGEPADTEVFEKAVKAQVDVYLEHGLPKRAEQFRKSLAAFYSIDHRLLRSTEHHRRVALHISPES